MRTLTSGILAASALIAGGLLVSGCATEDYVDQHIASVRTHVEEVDGKVGALSSRVDGVERVARDGVQRADAAAALAATKSNAKFAYSDLSQTTSVTFDTNKWALNDEAQAALTALAGRLASENKDVYLEIVGHGDPRGSVMANRELGAKRSLQVQRFLAGQGVALNRMNVVSWGEERVSDPKDRSPETLQQSRRVDVVVKG